MLNAASTSAARRAPREVVRPARRLAAAVIVLALAACSRAPEVNLPESTRGVELEEEARHGLQIDAAGRVRIDGVACWTQPEVEAALERVALSMRSDPERAAQIGRSRAPDEPFAVRIDRDAHFEVAARCLVQCTYRECIWRLRVAVVDPRSGDERWLHVDGMNPDPGCANEPWKVLRDSDLDPGPAWVGLSLHARTPICATPSAHLPDAPWSIAQDPPTSSFDFDDGLTWDDVCAVVGRRRARVCHLGISGHIEASAPWQEAVAVLDAALELGVERFWFSPYDDHMDPKWNPPAVNRGIDLNWYDGRRR